MRKFKRSDPNFGLTSLLDALACGLGAVLLILIVIKFKAHTTDPTEQLEKLQAELAAGQTEVVQLQQSLDEINELIAMETAEQEASEQGQSETESQQAKLLQTIANEMAVVANLEQQLAAMAKLPTPSDAVALSGTGNQNYITGMKVEGKQIGILVDKSASMMGDNLVEVLRYLALSDAQRVQTAKWQRTIRTAKWLLARVPDDSRVTVVTFSEDAKRLGQNDRNSPKLTASMRAIVSDLGAVVPDGGTNLQVGLAELFRINNQITDVYLITDGLPTLGDGLSLKCRNIFRSSKSISSVCRQELLVATAQRFPKNVTMNIILLPIEGDPHASALYWEWANSTYGTFLSPASEWP